MKAKREKQKPAAAPAKPSGGAGWLPWAAAVAAAVLAVFVCYSPALNGPFLFDDNYLPVAMSDVAKAPLTSWFHGVRPILMISYWMNARVSGADTWSYHVSNLLIHLITGGLVFLIVRRLLGWARAAESRRNLLAGFAALVFLLHPIQTEAVAYLAGRSEALSVMFLFAAFTLFLYRRQEAVTWPLAGGLLALFGAALLSKEHTIVLPALLVLTDVWWNPGKRVEAVRRNWRVYAPLALGAAGGVAVFWNLLTRASTAGFGFKDFTWYQYFFTQCRALFVYIGEFLFPVQLTADWDFPISKTILDRGAIFGLLALAGLAYAAWHFRRRFPLAGYGFFVFLLLMAPTSSILPIADAIAERRMYFAMIGLLLIAVDMLGRVKLENRGLAAVSAAVVLAAAGATYVRAQVWSDAVPLWEDNVRKSPNKARAHFNLGFAYYAQGRPELALREFERTAQLQPPTAELLLDWGLALDQLNQPERALGKLQEAARLRPTAHVYSQIGMMYGKLSRWPEALDALATAQKLDPAFPYTYVNLGKVHMLTGELQTAVGDYRRALELDPTLDDARHDLAIAAARLRSGK
jgi:protein O-mannosyl-transferase